MGKIRRMLGLLAALALLAACFGGALAEQALQLPAATRIVAEEAFAGLESVRRVVLPEGVEELRSRAFAGSGVTEINLPSSLKFIAEDAFAGTSLAKVTAAEGTYAYNWAVSHGYISQTPALSASLSASAAAAKPGDAVTWTVKTAGNTGACRYTFHLYRDSAEVASMGPGSENTFTRMLDAAGAYHVVCDVADDVGSVSVMGGSVNVADTQLSGQITADRTRASVGDTINWTVRVSGGSGNYTYTYEIYRDKARIFRSPAINDNLLTFNFDKAGTYHVACAVADGAKRLDLTGAEIAVTESATGLTFTLTAEKETLRTAETQVWHASAKGGKAPCRYSYTLKRGNATVETQEYSTESAFRATFLKSGSYTLNVKVRDGSGTVVSRDFDFSVSRGGTALTGVVRIYVDIDAMGNVIENNSKTGHYELQINNDSGDGLCFDNKWFDAPVFSFGSTGGGAVAVFEATDVSRHNALLYTVSFPTTADKVDQFLHTVLPNQYLVITSESRDGGSYVYPSKKSYVIKTDNCFTTAAAWCSLLGYSKLTEIVSASTSYTDYLAWQMYNQHGHEWTFVGEY